MDKNHLAEAGFYYTNLSGVLCCALCRAQVGHWEGDDPIKDHQRWSPSCGLIRGLSSGTSLMVLPTSLPHRLSSLPEATSVGLNAVSTVICISFFVKCTPLKTPALIFNAFYSYKSQNF